MKPQTFMNLSGRAVRAVLDFYKLPLEDLLVVCDDFNLPLGKLRVRAKGSHGGQNGLRNIQEQLGTDDYARLRIGVGQPAPGEAVDFVLSKFKPGERAAVEDAVAGAAAGRGASGSAGPRGLHEPVQRAGKAGRKTKKRTKSRAGKTAEKGKPDATPKKCDAD